MQIPVQIGVKGQAVLGMLHIPQKRAEGSPVILLCYGLDGKRAEVHRMATIAARQAESRGITMLRFDYRGLGLSDGEFWHTSISKKIEDTLAMIDFVTGCFQNERFALIPLGFSDGARIAAGLYKQRACISGLAFWSPVFHSIAADFTDKKNSRITRHPVTRELVYPFNGIWMGLEYLNEQTGMANAIHDCFGFKGPKLSCFGSADQHTGDTRRELESLVAQAANNWKVITIPGANHIFNRATWAETVIDQTLNWTIEVGKQSAQ